MVTGGRASFKSISESISISDVVVGGKLVLIPYRGTVYILKELRNTPAILDITRGTRQILKQLRDTVSI